MNHEVFTIQNLQRSGGFHVAVSTTSFVIPYLVSKTATSTYAMASGNEGAGGNRTYGML